MNGRGWQLTTLSLFLVIGCLIAPSYMRIAENGYLTRGGLLRVGSASLPTRLYVALTRFEEEEAVGYQKIL